MTARILIRNATIITMDEHLGDLKRADLLIDGEKIGSIGQIGAVNAEIIDGTGFIVIPGLVNAHMHTWQTGLRGIAANWTLLEYFRKMHAGLATLFRPEDLHIATLMGALNQLDCGTTMLVDWCHNNPTPAHNDAAIDALFESGIRAAFFHGTPKPDPKPGEPGFWEILHPRAELERLLKHRVGGLVSAGAAILGPHYATLDVTLHDFRMAKELGIVASMHQGGGAARTPEGWARLETENLLGPRINIVHGNNLSDNQLARFCELGMSFSVAAENEMTQGHGFPIIGRLRKLGRVPSLGVDLESVISGEMFTQARVALGMQRALDNQAERETTGSIPATTTITAREALAWVTIEGARMLCMEDRVGSITPGKQADIVLIAAGALNMQPVHDPVSAVVMQTSLANIDSVMVAGRWRKRNGRLLAEGLAEKIDRLRGSGQRILQAMGLLAGETNAAAR
jgi:cytosine/adenosine deaminase-related metal-dependent hydrolase